ncbi:MAG: hypothetical protein AB1489_37060 [Acidobacteriota bacterium]
MNFSEEELEKYRQALKDRVCSICQELGYDKVCGGVEGNCQIEQHLPKILEAVLSTPYSNNIADYLPKLRELVCSGCLNQDEHGRCELRDLAYCGLDSLFVLVVQTIEDVNRQSSMVQTTKPFI